MGSPYSKRAIAFVKNNPGCCKWDLASHLTYNGRRCPSKQYYLVNTQIRLGNIVAIHCGNKYELYVPEDVPRSAKEEHIAACESVGLQPDTPKEILHDMLIDLAGGYER